MMIDIQRTALTGAQFEAEIDGIIKRAPTLTAEALAVAIRVTLDAHNRYDALFTLILKAVAAMPEPQRSEACDLLAKVADEKVRWSAYKPALDRLREWGIEAVHLHQADRLVIAQRVEQVSAVRAFVGTLVQQAAE